jgi:hypothetical protein
LTNVIGLNITGLQQVVQLGTEFTGVILPDGSIRIVQPVLLLGKPIRLIGSSFRDEIDLKAGLAEDLERVQCLSNEKACGDC